ncbi:hypothetical protein BO71DRAFT_86558 [Aspergillus ellipticus CBS 707.79]|uniref:Uncharacterized protein n=1 Tax=Aspergillus ellipticus CBS 707.79 TaxID=1448320 RepID=A0A319E8H9_9EURO|nr:hypothetical protein BO71DRAFT_86558 [Aspergillus ellipticus CBS 707.79]
MQMIDQRVVIREDSSPASGGVRLINNNRNGCDRWWLFYFSCFLFRFFFFALHIVFHDFITLLAASASASIYPNRIVCTGYCLFS